MSEYPGFVLKAGQMNVDGESVCAALIEFPNDPPDYLTNNIIWNRVPIAIVTEEEIESLRSKLSAAEARAEKAEALLNEAHDWFERFRPEWGPGTLPTWFVDVRAALKKEQGNG